jgi:ABC-type glycerol-3-phosphate transport system substrate-binding protein
MSSRVRAALLLVLLLAACGGSTTAESPLAHRIEHLKEHGFDVDEVAPEGDPMPEAVAVVQLDGATVTIYAYEAKADALRATSAFAAEEQAAPDSVRVQREGRNVYVARVPEGGKLPATDVEDVVFTSEEEH